MNSCCSNNNNNNNNCCPCCGRILCITGPTGPMGPQGEQGEAGPRGEQGIKGLKGDKGDQGMTGPRGDQGPTTIKIGNVETIPFEKKAEIENVGTSEDLILNFKIPQGIKGDKGEQGEIGPRGLPGEIGRTEHISIDLTETVEEGEKAQVLDDFENFVHHLTFYIPKGDKGDTGPQGERGKTGPAGPPGTLGPTSYNAIAFASFGDTTKSGIAQIHNTRIMPGNNEFISIPNGTDIQISKTGVFEITLCGRISGVTKTDGASFSLFNATTNTVVNDLLFELEKGDTPDMDFSETNVVDIVAPATLQLKTSFLSDNTSLNIKFSYMNVIIKRFNI